MAGLLGIGPDHEQRERGGGRVAGRRFWQRQCNGRARGIGSVSYVFLGAYETVKKRGVEWRGRQVEVRSEGTSRARWTRRVRPRVRWRC